MTVITTVKMTSSLPQGVPAQSRSETWEIRHSMTACYAGGRDTAWSGAPARGSQEVVTRGWCLLNGDWTEAQGLDEGGGRDIICYF